MVKNWAMKTPKNFKFTAKFPKVITHAKRLKEVDEELGHFFDVMGPLENKTLADSVKNVQEDKRVKQAIIAANNHYAGFGPGTALFLIS